MQPERPRPERWLTRETVLAQLNSAARARWGDERVEALQATLESAADAVWRVVQTPVDLLDEEPDLVASAETP